jgi:hypothetical protein
MRETECFIHHGFIAALQLQDIDLNIQGKLP